MTRVMITDGNNVHAPDYHAEVTAEKIVVVAETASPDIVAASRALRKKIEAILTSHHQGVHDAEQAKLAEQGAAYYGGHGNAGEKQHDASEHVDDEILAEIVAASEGTILQAHFARAEVQIVILEILHHETRSQMNVHSLVHETAERLARKPRLVS